MGDTAVVPYDQQTSASRSSVLMGNAVLEPAATSRRSSATMAARLEGVDESAVVVDGGEVRIGDRATPIRDVARARARAARRRDHRRSARSRKEAEPDHPLGGTAAFYEFNCTAVEVEVDRETGDITIHRHVTVSDVGKALNPARSAARTRARRSWASATR